MAKDVHQFLSGHNVSQFQSGLITADSHAWTIRTFPGGTTLANSQAGSLLPIPKRSPMLTAHGQYQKYMEFFGDVIFNFHGYLLLLNANIFQDMKVVKPTIGKGKGIEVNHSHCFSITEPYKIYNGEHLPHIEQDGKIQFVTFRLNDSLPGAILKQMEERLQEAIVYFNNIQDDDLNSYIKRLEYWINQGKGSCMLQFDEIQKIVETSLHHYDGLYYDLYDYVIMPNHVHMLVLPDESLKIIMARLKQFTTRAINKIRGERGAIWMPDYFDRMIRTVDEFQRYSEYIKTNPQNWEDVAEEA